MNADHGLAQVAAGPERNGTARATAPDGEYDPVPHRSRLDHGRGGGAAGHRLAVDGRDDIAAVHGPGGGQPADRARDSVDRRELDAQVAQRCRLGGLLGVHHVQGVLLDHLLLALAVREEFLLWHDGVVRAEPRLYRGDYVEWRRRPGAADIGDGDHVEVA